MNLVKLFCLSLFLGSSVQAEVIWFVVSESGIQSDRTVVPEPGEVILDDLQIEQFKAIQAVKNESQEKLKKSLQTECDRYQGSLASQICVTEDNNTNSFEYVSVSSGYTEDHFKYHNEMSGKAYCKLNDSKISYFDKYVRSHQILKSECISHIAVAPKK